jgi:short-subunit dehydrogenase
MAQPTFTLITGASSGIGECFARALAPRGRNLILVARSKAKLDALAEQLRAQHLVLAEPMDFDLGQPGAAAQLAARLRERKFTVDFLINNAGFGAQGEFAKLSFERQSEMLRLNVQAVVELTHLLLPAMIEQSNGAIINVSSTASFQPVPYITLYAATKAFVTSFSLGLAEEVRLYGISVVTFCPGGTRTNFTVASQFRERKSPLRMQSPEEVVAAALKSLDRGGGLVVPGFMNKVSVAAQRLAPRSLVVKAAARLFRD